MKKRWLSLLLALALLCSLLPAVAAPVRASEQLAYTPYANVEYGYTDQVEVGTIRYICQSTGRKYFNWNYWPASSFGGYASPGSECGTACISMALSYVGINKTPKEILNAHNGYTYFDGWGADYLLTNISEGMDNYISGNGKYSPVILHLNYGQSIESNDRGHFVMIVGQVSDNVWQIMDPATETLTNYTINGTSIKYMGIDNKIDSVRQYYHANAAPIIDCIEEEYNCYTRVRTPEASKLWNMPCSDKTSPSAQVLDWTAAGGSYVADMIYKNTEGNYWYRVKNGDSVCYLYAGNTDSAEHLDPGVTVSGLVVPEKLTPGAVFNIAGLVSSPNLPFLEIGAYIYEGTQVAGDYCLSSVDRTGLTTSYDIRNGAVNKKLSFGQLAEGTYTYLLTIEVNRRAAPGNQLSVYPEIITLAKAVFTVGNGTPSTPSGEVHRGIDVSHHQKTIDWDTAASHIEFAILRCGYGDDIASQDDQQWKANADACTRLGIPFGVYIYSYALTDAQARSEANHVLRLIEGYDPALPIYLDLEDQSILNSCSKADILRHAQIFCDIIEDAGYEVGIYANYNWWTNYLTDSAYDQWSRWIARYASATGYSKSYQMWQYTDSGSVPGISTSVDMNYWYGPLPGAEHTHSYEAAVTKAATCTQSGVMTYTCSCGDSYTEAIAPAGHQYTAERVEATCIAPGYTVHTCSVCADSYTVYDDAAGEWSEEKPEGVDESLIETRTEYRYRDYETTTSYDPAVPGWELLGSTWQNTGSGRVDYVKSWPSGFLTSHSLYAQYHNSPKSASETATDKTEITGDAVSGYLYYHWCRGIYNEGPINRGSKSSRQGEFTAFHAFYSTTDPATLTADTDGSVVFPNGSCCKDSHWYFHTPVNTQTYTTYRNQFRYGRWTDWSDWSDTVYTETDTRTVETRTVYRDISGGLGDHEWDSGVVTADPTCLEAGSITYTCIHCGETRSEDWGEPLGHAWDEGVVTLEPTEDSEGLMTYTCGRCGETRTEVIPALEHEHRYEAITTPPTCTDQGYTTYLCSCGSAYTTDFVDALGHAFTDWTVVQAPTATREGLEIRLCTRCDHQEQRSIPKLENPFTDVPVGSFYYDPVLWAVENGITNGTSATTFGPDNQCMRAHVVTFLHRAAGSPVPGSSRNPFTDVKTSDFFYAPVLWAVEKGITNGVSATSFGSYDVCNRAAVVTFLWRAAGSPEPQSTSHPFTDVKTTDFYYKPVLWAVENGITNGVDATHFGPASPCNRAQVVTFLYRAYN